MSQMQKLDVTKPLETLGSSAGLHAGHPPSSHVEVDSLSDRDLYYRAKRVIDVMLSALLLILFSPLILAIALAIKLDSPGPVVFMQERMGYDWQRKRERVFSFYKFRSMYHNCDQSVHEAHVKAWVRNNSNGSGPTLVKLTDDPRVTRVGRFLRKSSLDEIPQLVNVLRGHMSLVGPRPVPLYEVAEYDAWHRGRLQAVPGITGMWQVYGRGTVTLDEMARLDILYIQQQSLWLDIKLLLLTIPVVLTGNGAV